MTSTSTNVLRTSVFKIQDFTFTQSEESKTDSIITFPNVLLKALENQNMLYIYYEKWLSGKKQLIQPMSIKEFLEFVKLNISKHNKLMSINSLPSQSQLNQHINNSMNALNSSQNQEDTHNISQSIIKHQSIEDYLTPEQIMILGLLEQKEINFDKDYLISKINKAEISNKSLESFSYGLLLVLLNKEISLFYRDNETFNDKLHSTKEEKTLDNLFFNLEKQLEYNFSNQLVGLQSNSHGGLKNIDEADGIEKSMAKSINDLSSAFKLIIDYNDSILRKNLENTIENDPIAEKEKSLLIFSQVPGINRYLMETPPLKEEHYRKALKCEIYPFLKMPIIIYEKFKTITTFEDIMLRIYPNRQFDFGNRIYTESMNRDILTQVLLKSAMYDSEMLSMYNERDDSIYLTVYYKVPNGRVYHKMIKHRYLSLPEFQNWINVLKPNVIKEESALQNISDLAQISKNQASNAKSSKVLPKPNVKDQQPEVIPQDKYSIHLSSDLSNDKIIYQADDNKVGEVIEKIKYMYPSDNSIIIRKNINFGIYNTFMNYVVKDNLVFGIRKNNKNDNELWINFENGIKMSIAYNGPYDNTILPPSNKLEFNENEDNKHRQFHSNMQNGSNIVFTLLNGLEIQILPSGDILQKNHSLDSDEDLNNKESHRIITSKASVLSYSQLNGVHIMYANGNTCEIKNNVSINTNNKGFRVARRMKDNYKYELDKINVTNQTDPESNTQTMIRADKVMSIKYIDGSLLTIHNDNTKIYSYPKKDKYLIENEDFASVEIRYDEVKKNMKTEISEGSIDALLGSDDIMTRSYDGKLNRVIFPDLTEIYTYKEKKAKEEFEKFTYNTITLIYRPDGTVIKVQQDGEVAIISGKEREKLNTKGNEVFYDRKDIDYLFEIFGKVEERKGGVYSADLFKGKLWTNDYERNIFEINTQGEAKEKLAVTLDTDQSQKTIDEIIPYSPSDNQYTEIKKIDDVIHIEKTTINPIIVNEPAKNQTNAVGFTTKGSVIIQQSAIGRQSKLGSKTGLPVASQFDKNIQKLHSQGEKSETNIKEMQVQNYEKQEFEFIHPESVYLQTPNNLMPQRLFVISNDNTGYELLNEEQVRHFKDTHSETKNRNCQYSRKEIKEGLISHCWLEIYRTTKEMINDTHLINKIKIPKNLEKIVSTPQQSQFPVKETYLYRNLVEYPELTEESREEIEQSIKIKDSWFENKLKEFGKKENLPSKESLESTREIQRRILKERQTKEFKLEYEELRHLSLTDVLINKNNEAYSILFNIDDHIIEKINRIIHEDSDLRRMPLDLKLISIDQLLVSLRDLKDKPKRNRGRKVKEALENLKMNKEIKFIPSYFNSEEGEPFSRKYEMNLGKPKIHVHKNSSINEERQFDAIEALEEEDQDEKEIILQNNFKDDENNEVNAKQEENSQDKNEYFSDMEMENTKKQDFGSIVFLKNEAHEFNYTPKHFIKSYNKPILPSILKQKERYMKEYEAKKKAEAQKYYDIRNYKFTVEGFERKKLPDINYLKTTFPEAEFNEDYIYIEKMTDPRIKTSSVARRLYFNAPSVNEIRKNGQHNFLIQAIDQKKTYDEMMERLNLMITSELCDPLNKNLKIDPVKLQFGYLVIGQMYYADIHIRNDDNLSTRVQVLKEKPDLKESLKISLEHFTGGKISPGMSKKIRIVIDATSVEKIENNKFENAFMNIKVQDNIRIITKSFNYKIPIKAILTTEEGFENAKANYARENKIAQFISCGKVYNPEIHKKNFHVEVKLPPIYEKVVANHFGESMIHGGDSQYVIEETD